VAGGGCELEQGVDEIGVAGRLGEFFHSSLSGAGNVFAPRAGRVGTPSAQTWCTRVLFRDRLPDKLAGMPNHRTLRGRTSRSERPDWDPLIDLVGLELVRWFMWMGQVELVDDTRVHAYKHIATRRYFHIGEDGRLFAYASPDRFTEIEAREAVDEAFDGWDDLLPEPDLDAAIALAELRERVTA
jgi:hypothetical protein